MKKLLATMMAIVSLISIAVLPAAASGVDLENTVMPCYEYTNNTVTSLRISANGVATATSKLSGYRNLTTKINIYMYLERKVDGEWVAIDSWWADENTYSLTLEETFSVDPGFTYRIHASYYAYSGSDFEHIDEYSQEVRY